MHAGWREGQTSDGAPSLCKAARLGYYARSVILVICAVTNSVAATRVSGRPRRRRREPQLRRGKFENLRARTLQGWESGGPMPYPNVLQAALTRSKRAADPF